MFRLGPPDFHPQTPNCPEETLTREYVHSGYKETIEGLEVILFFFFWQHIVYSNQNDSALSLSLIKAIYFIGCICWCLQEAREISLSQVQAFTKPIIVKCKEVNFLGIWCIYTHSYATGELLYMYFVVLSASFYIPSQALRKYHRAINESRAQKRKVLQILLCLVKGWVHYFQDM